MINNNQYCLMQHSDSGNIQSNAGSNAIFCITDATGPMLLDHRQSVSYTAFNKASHISQGNLDYFITYGPDRLRRKTQLNSGIGDDVLLTKYYAFGDYEKEVTPTGTRHLHYIYGGDGLAAIYVKYGNAPDSLYFIVNDHIGSLVGAINSTTGTIYRQNFDSWGRKRNPVTWSYTNIPDFPFDRGYTGHEHLKWFGLINMNGRMYDAALCRFLSPDPYVQMPDYTQNFNRYSYCLNNPLKFTDSSGEFYHLIAGAIIGGYINWATHGFKWTWEGAKYFGIGAVAGALAAGVGAGVGAAIAGNAAAGGGFAAGFLGTASISSTGFVAGAVTGAAAGVTNGLIMGTGNGMISGQNFGDAFGQGGLDQAWKQGLIGGATGGLLGGIDAANRGRDFWTGSYKQFDLEPALLANTDNVVTDSYVFPDDATVANADSYKVYYKSEKGVTGINDYVSPGKYIKNPVDGVATSKFTNQVFKIPDGGRVLVRMGGSVEFTNGYGFYDGLLLLNRAGWQDSQYFIDMGAYEGWKSLFNAASLWIK